MKRVLWVAATLANILWIADILPSLQSPYQFYVRLSSIVLLSCLVIHEVYPWRKRSAYDRAIGEQKRRAKRMEKSLAGHRMLGQPTYDPIHGVMSWPVKAPLTWRHQAVDATLWLFNRRLLPKRFVVWICQKLGWKWEEK